MYWIISLALSSSARSSFTSPSSLDEPFITSSSIVGSMEVTVWRSETSVESGFWISSIILPSTLTWTSWIRPLSPLAAPRALLTMGRWWRIAVLPRMSSYIVIMGALSATLLGIIFPAACYMRLGPVNYDFGDLGWMGRVPNWY